MAPLGKLGKGSGRLVGGQLCGHVPQLVQVAVKALPEGAAPAKPSVFFKKIRKSGHSKADSMVVISGLDRSP